MRRPYTRQERDALVIGLGWIAFSLVMLALMLAGYLGAFPP